MSQYTLDFAACGPEQHGRVGGKCASLGALINAGAPVPPGFAVTTDAYRDLLATDGLAAQIHALLAPLHEENLAELETISAGIRALIEARPLPAAVERAIRDGYAALCAQVGAADLPVAVRSSATAEDLPGASFAGQQDTYLWISGADAVVAHVRRCWASLYTARALAYRHDKGFAHEQVGMAVAVQKMVNARSAGVAMTINPIDGDRSKIVIDASWGLGEAVVSGEVTPDNFVVDKVVFAIVRRTISHKHIEYVADAASNMVVTRSVEPSRRVAPSLSDDEIVAVARLARQAEKHYRTPQDVEWALDADLAAPHNIVLLQSRPETVWSQKQAAPSAPQAAGARSVLDSLMKPVQVRLDGEQGS